MNRHERRKQTATLKRIPLKDIQQGPIRHLTLPPLLVTRILGLYESLKGFYDPSDGVAGWIEGFQRDMHPESEVIIWEGIARAIKQFTEGREPLSPEARKEILGLALTGGRDVACKHVSPADAQAFLKILTAASLSSG